MAAKIDLNYRGEPPKPEISVGQFFPDNEPLSETFVSRATAAIHPSDGTESSNTTAAGFPANGLSVNESTVLIRTQTTRRS